MPASARTQEPSSPAFFALAAHAVRWRLLTELASSDRTVGELVTLSGQPQSLVSYHLRQLREAEVVGMRRSAADHRDTYYHLDLVRCADAIDRAAGALHPGLSAPSIRTDERDAGHSRRARVLFLCTGNSSRSQMAEAFAMQLGDELLDASSAGSHPKPTRAEVGPALRAYGIEWSGRSKHLDAYRAQPFDYVVTLCDRVREVCPEFPGTAERMAERIHWNVPDPSDTGTPEAFEDAAAEIETRLRFFIARVRADVETQQQKEETHAGLR
jgi:protein-tyrosine-phosphatase